jgi:hypothetical protein
VFRVERHQLATMAPEQADREHGGDVAEDVEAFDAVRG